MHPIASFERYTMSNLMSDLQAISDRTTTSNIIHAIALSWLLLQTCMKKSKPYNVLSCNLQISSRALPTGLWGDLIIYVAFLFPLVW
jgi:hypothetical protein